MNYESFQSWLSRYGQAWETRDPVAAANLFAEDGTYQVTPFEEPLRGRSAILQYWLQVPRSQDAIQFQHEILAVTEYVGIARWRASLVRTTTRMHVELDGIFVVSLDADHYCTMFREWWHRREKRLKDSGA